VATRAFIVVASRESPIAAVSIAALIFPRRRAVGFWGAGATAVTAGIGALG